MVGALRAGYGLAQSLQILVEQLPQPAAGEFARVVRAMGLGVPVQDALQAMADRIGTNDVELVVTTIIVQHQVGGNLAETLATIADTINDRLRIQREIGVMTSQQRLSGYVLVAMPIFIALIIALISPGYFKPFSSRAGRGHCLSWRWGCSSWVLCSCARPSTSRCER
jgi:tight adherence protein B